MSTDNTRSMTFQAEPPAAFAALQEAARRSGLRFVAGDATAGTAVFSSGFTLMTFGEKVTARITKQAPGTVQVTLSSGPQFGVVGFRGRKGAGLDRMAQSLGELLPRAG
jgi:hypothetical protein